MFVIMLTTKGRAVMSQFKVLRNLSREEKVYDFCLQWLMNTDGNFNVLIDQFRSSGWNFDEFKRLAQSRNWFVNSMNKLKD